MSSLTKRLLLVGGVVILVAALAVTLWVRRFHSYTPVEAIRDLQAAAEAHGAQRPVKRFLEVRYGPLTEPNNRQEAFKDFFNVGHIEGLFLITDQLPPDQKQKNIKQMARWISSYRRTMSPVEKEQLKRYFRSDIGRNRVQEATVHYLKKDYRWRAETGPVILELMTTLGELEAP